ncbi:unnamed protein product [Rotaria socialis]|uniref:Uncharacterized protein n=1 Tax=Rotaria socialis TaxID=392032 RepID=A0A819BYI7_9BILA|nr:unnamed protein product [Rotaria socialis]CAF4501094.1 unnamed protein product [Rotaria socialis]
MVNVTLSTNRRTETQLVRMFLVQVGVQIVLTVPPCVADLLLSFPSIYQSTAHFYSIFLILRVIFHISYATPFSVNILSAHMFRKRFIELILKIYPYINRNRIQSIRHIGAPTAIQINVCCDESYL